MSYFIPSFFQKRILRYALSRLELLDTDALDLDKLDITWGKKSTVELREVRVHPNKLATLLELPRSLAIVSAQILFLRLTVPSDLYKSGILVEAHGIDVHVNTYLENQGKVGTTSPKNRKGQQERNSKGAKANRPRSTQTHVHDPGGPRSYHSPATNSDNDDQDHPSEHLPTTSDLAKSFLEAEPKEKKAELQAAFTQSQILGDSHISSEDGDEASDLGVASPISLPAFLADFLKGVGDRIQLQATDVALNIDLRIELPTENSARSDSSGKSELVALRIAVADISLDGVTSLKSHNIRRLTINNTEAMLVCEASLFTNLVQSAGPPSPVTTHASTLEKTSNEASETVSSVPAVSSNEQCEPGLRSTYSECKSDKGIVTESVNETATHNSSENPYGLGDSQDYDSSPEDRFFTDEAHDSQMGQDLAHSVVLPSPLYRDSTDLRRPHLPLTDSHRPLVEGYSRGDETHPATLRSMASEGYHTEEDEQRHEGIAEDLSDKSSFEGLPRLANSSQLRAVAPSASIVTSSSPALDQISLVSEDLSQSKFFSHEEAESMYMSAFSHAMESTNHDGGSVPGKWHASDSDTEDVATANESFQTSSKIPDHDKGGLGQPQSPALLLANDAYFNNGEELFSRALDSQRPDQAPSPRSQKSTAARTEAEEHSNLVQQRAIPLEGSDTSSAESKSSFNTAKRILAIDTITVELPQSASGAMDDAVDNRNSSPTADSSIRSNNAPKDSGADAIGSSGIASGFHDGQEDHNSTSPLSIGIGSIHLFGDMGLTRMVVIIAQQINLVPKSTLTKDGETDTAQPASSSKSPLELSVRQASWKFLDVVKGSPVINSPTVRPTQYLPSDSEILLKADMNDFHVSYGREDNSSSLKMSLGKFSLGYASENVLSFSSDLKMRDSTRDILAPRLADIELTMVQRNGVTKVDLTTLPLYVLLDLRRLDETFSWFGGLSSMLDLGSSMVSTVTINDIAPKAIRPKKGTRGVRFESPRPEKPSLARSKQPENKVTARIGGVVVDLNGSQTSLRVESTAMKFVSRIDKLAVQVDRIKLSGPYLYPAGSEPSITARLRNLRIEYRSTPRDDDLDRLVALLSPSNDNYERDDDILLDTLLRQRSKGGIVRLSIESLDGHLPNIDDLQRFPVLTEDLKKLSTVAKYLPEDDRPGMLSLVLIHDIKIEAVLRGDFGVMNLLAKDIEVAHVTFPVLMAAAVNTLSLHRNRTENLITDARPMKVGGESVPMLMARFIGNEMEPTAKVKLYNAQFEYHVSTVMAIMGYEKATSSEVVVADMVSSIATLTNHNQVKSSHPKSSSQSSADSINSASSKNLKFDVVLRDSIIGLNPRNSQAKGLVVLTDTHFLGAMPKDDEANAILEVRKASIMIIDDIEHSAQVDPASTRQVSDVRKNQIEALTDQGYVIVSSISAAKAVIRLEAFPSKAVDVEIRDDLFVLETCADSTHTLQSIMSGLSPPIPTSTELKYRTEVVPVEDMLASFTSGPLATQQAYDEEDVAANDELALGLDEGDMVDDEVPQNLEFVSSFYNPDPDALSQGITDSMLEDDLESLAAPSVVREIGDRNLLESFQVQTGVAPGGMTLDFQDNHFGSNSTIAGTAHRWNTSQNTYNLGNDPKLHTSPLTVRVRDVHFIWNLYDGYDWQHTREIITHAVEDVQIKATERFSRRNKPRSLDPEEEQEAVIGDFLFNSIYIGVPANRDPKDLARRVNRDIDDLISETDTYAQSSASGSPSRQGHAPRPRNRKLRLVRSKHHKMAFELKGISADVVVFPPDSGETQSSIDIRIQDLEIYDHLPTSTWRKFATYLHDIGERESGASIVHLEILNVKPVPNLAASEIMLKATVLPLRLHVDQDALDFLVRFFEFKGDSALSETSKAEAAFLQRTEVNSIRVKLDFKPKRVDYAGLRSGRTTEFMNFIVLQEADMVLRHAIIYGVSGFDKLGKTLNDIWMPDVKRNQLPGILAGLAPKGAVAFAKTTTTELVKLGAKLAIGTQTVLQGAEGLLNPPSSSRQDVSSGWEDAELDDEEKKQISLYADQPVGVIQGLRGGYASLERDLLTAKDAIIAMPGEIIESSTASGVAKAVLRNAPTVILRPAMGVSKAIGQTLMGATNSLDPGNRRRVEDKYKRY
ncbi:autophagy-related protein 2, partial [Lecanoromycetidae sp. Uapishka_2]